MSKSETARNQKNYLALHSLRVQGLLSFGEETGFEFGRLNLLVGPNGSGKSNLIDCLRIFKNCPLDVQVTFNDVGFEDWLYMGGRPEVPVYIEVCVELPGTPELLRHHLLLAPTSHSSARLEETIDLQPQDSGRFWVLFQLTAVRGAEVIYRDFQDADGSRQPEDGEPRYRWLTEEEFNPLQSILAQLRDMKQYPEITNLAKLYSNFRVYSEWSFGRGSALRSSTSADGTNAYLSEDMGNLALALNGLQGSLAHDKIQKLLRELKETYRDYITRVSRNRVDLELKEVPFDRPLPARRLSDGTLRFLALAAILLHPEPPPMICLEEPELGMHPDMIRLIADMIIEAAQKTQLIVTTHSEHLLTALEDNFDALFSFDAGLSGSCVRRYSRDDFQVWRQGHRLGELWTSGELGGNRW